MTMPERTPEIVVVTGGSAGLGRAIVRRFAEAGAHVAIIARGRERLDDAKREVEAAGGSALAISQDVADADGVERAAEQIERELGPIDVWVNNAMTSVFSPVSKMQADEYRRVTEVTYLGYVYGTLAALRRMRARDRGVIVQVGSALAHRSIPLQSAYCAAKHAIVGFTASLRSELIHERSRVRATVVQMPGLNTTQFDWVKSRLPGLPQPVGTVFQPEVGADAVYHAAHHDVGQELLVGGSTVEAVLGNRVAPTLLDHYMASHAYDQQHTDGPPVERPDNLWEPVPGNQAAHGRFDEQAKSHSLELELATTSRGTLAVAAAGVAGLVLGALSARGTGESR